MVDSEVESLKLHSQELRQHLFAVSGMCCAPPESGDECGDNAERPDSAHTAASEVERLHAEIESLRLRAKQAAATCTICSTAMQNKTPVLVDMTKGCLHLSTELVRSEQLSKHLAVPILDRERVVGVLNVATRSQQPNLASQKQMLEAIGREIGPVVAQAMLHQRVRQEQRKLSAVLNATTDLVLVLDYSLHILLLNEAALQILNVSKDEVLGRPVSALNLPRLDAVLTASDESSFVEEVSMPLGRTLQASASHVRDVGWVIVMRDVTSFKELDRLRTEWVASVSHDLKGPMATVQLSADLIEMAGPLNQMQQRKLQAVADAIERMRSLVTGVLDLARLEAGPTFRNEVVCLSEVLRSVNEELRPLAEARAQALTLIIPNELPPVSGDKQLLTRACANLVHNALKYTPPQGWVRLSATVDGAMVVVKVADDGPGIPLELQSRLFEPFFRGTRATSQIEGTGLGLSIVKSIIEKHRGTINVESSLGAGAVFSFRIPIAPGDTI